MFQKKKVFKKKELKPDQKNTNFAAARDESTAKGEREWVEKMENERCGSSCKNRYWSYNEKHTFKQNIVYGENVTACVSHYYLSISLKTLSDTNFRFWNSIRESCGLHSSWARWLRNRKLRAGTLQPLQV